MISTKTIACTCTNCPSNSSKDEIVTAVEEKVNRTLSMYVDQYETAVSDDIHEEVNHRPADQEWTVCTP